MNQGNNRNYLYGMHTTLMQGLQSNPSLFSKTAPGAFSPNNQHMATGSAARNNMPTLTNTSLMSMRQQMDESNHDMVNMLTHQIGTVFNPLIQNANQSFQLLATQMGRMTDFFGAPQVPNQQIPQIQNMAPIQNAQVPNNDMILVPNNALMLVYQVQQPVPQVEPQAQPQVEPNSGVLLVNRNQNADEIVRNVQQNNLAGQNNIANLVDCSVVG
jgi:hypothetical protein